MDKSDIILWVISGGFSLMLLMWHGLNTRIDKIEERSNRDFEKFSKNFEEVDGQLYKINNRLDKIENRLDKVESKVNDINNNVTHLMWHNQTYPYREIKEE